jgi:hypothetical protein
MESKMTSSTVALETALAAVFCEAKNLGYDIEALAEAAKSGLFDGGKPYRWASADVVVPASHAIDKAIAIAA